MFRKRKAALQFSGGKDSLACLYMLKPFWHQIDVVWLNTGAALPETLEQMVKIRAMVPRFVEIRSDQPADIARNGMPVDVLPVSCTSEHRLVSVGDAPLMRPFLDCCRNNLWLPMLHAMQGYDLIIRGQKNCDAKKAPIKSGDVENGVEYYFPLEEWTEEEVLGYLADNDIELPPTYQYFKSSPDCWSCTAYLSENKGKREYLRRFHPEKSAVVEQRIQLIRSAVLGELAHLGGE